MLDRCTSTSVLTNAYKQDSLESELSEGLIPCFDHLLFLRLPCLVACLNGSFQNPGKWDYICGHLCLLASQVHRFFHISTVSTETLFILLYFCLIVWASCWTLKWYCTFHVLAYTLLLLDVSSTDIISTAFFYSWKL